MGKTRDSSKVGLIHVPETTVSSYVVKRERYVSRPVGLWIYPVGISLKEVSVSSTTSEESLES